MGKTFLSHEIVCTPKIRIQRNSSAELCGKMFAIRYFCVQTGEHFILFLFFSSEYFSNNKNKRARVAVAAHRQQNQCRPQLKRIKKEKKQSLHRGMTLQRATSSQTQRKSSPKFVHNKCGDTKSGERKQTRKKKSKSLRKIFQTQNRRKIEWPTINMFSMHFMLAVSVCARASDRTRSRDPAQNSNHGYRRPPIHSRLELHTSTHCHRARIHSFLLSMMPSFISLFARILHC